jgi:chromosome partitioning protein
MSMGPDQPVAESVDQLSQRSNAILGSLRDRAEAIRATENREPLFKIGRAAELVGRTTGAIRDAERDGRLRAPERKQSNFRLGYTLSDLNVMRDVFGTRPWRANSDAPAILAVQNFKGGVGKSTLAVHLAQYLAVRGYRTLLVDCDSQASATMLFGYVPDLDVDEDQTLYPFLREAERTSLQYAVRDTHFDGLKLIPSNLRLFQAEYELAARMALGNSVLLDRLREGLASVSADFDVIVLDPPPALGAISLSVLRAANSLIVPVPPTLMDFSSTAAFLSMLNETLELLEARGFRSDLQLLRIVASRVDENKSIQRELLGMMKGLYGHHLLRTVLKDSAEIDNATSRLMTVYEQNGPITSREVRNRCLTYLDGVNGEIEVEMRKMWPSHASRLRQEGLV